METIGVRQRKAIIIHSPRSGRSAQLTQAVEALTSAGIELLETRSIADLDGLEPQGEQWKASGAELVVAAGGDGLVGGVVSHTLKSKLPVGIIPLGTANDIARSVGLPLDPVEAAQVIANGKPVDIDIGVTYPAEQAPHSEETTAIPASHYTYFAHALTVGLNVQFAQLATDKAIRKQYGAMTYPFAVVEALKNYQPLDFELHFSGLARNPIIDAPLTASQEQAILRCRSAQVTVVNSPVFWGPLQMSVPGVNLHDRLLDIVVIEDARIEQLMFRILQFFGRQEPQPAHTSTWHAQYPDLLNAELTNIPGVHHVKARGITIFTDGKPQDATLDGEVRGKTPVHAQVPHERLNLIVPSLLTTV